MPTRRGTTTDRSRSSSSDEIRIVHVSEKSTESVPPANIRSRADAPAEVADPAQLAGPADTAYPLQGADPARQAGSAGEPEFIRGEQPCQPGTAGPSRRPVVHGWAVPAAATSTCRPRRHYWPVTGPVCSWATQCLHVTFDAMVWSYSIRSDASDTSASSKQPRCIGEFLGYYFPIHSQVRQPDAVYWLHGLDEYSATQGTATGSAFRPGNRFYTQGSCQEVTITTAGSSCTGQDAWEVSVSSEKVDPQPGQIAIVWKALTVHHAQDLHTHLDLVTGGRIHHWTSGRPSRQMQRKRRLAFPMKKMRKVPGKCLLHNMHSSDRQSRCLKGASRSWQWGQREQQGHLCWIWVKRWTRRHFQRCWMQKAPRSSTSQWNRSFHKSRTD